MTWPKGVTTPPAITEKIGNILKYNSSTTVAIITFLAVFIYLYRTWLKVGKDIKQGVIFPHYNPPKGYSPAAARYITLMSYDNNALTAAIINLAVKKYLSIKKHNDGYILTKLSSEEELAPGEQVLLKKLFNQGKTFALKPRNHKQLNSAKEEHEKALKKDYLDIYFSHNSGVFWRSGLIVLGMYLVTNVIAGLTTNLAVIPIWIVGFFQFIVFGYLIFRIKAKSKGAIKDFDENESIFFTYFVTIVGSMITFFLTIFMINAYVRNEVTIPIFNVFFILIFILYVAFKYIMKAHSKKGRILIDKLEGFKKYLEVAEQDDLNLKHPPEKTPELFERYLPFAIALGVEVGWSSQFKQVFSSINSDNNSSGTYHPAWCDNNFNSDDIRSFSSDINDAISTASSDPLSSSGASGGGSSGGGGGSSGGGGGGGGGGGW